MLFSEEHVKRARAIAKNSAMKYERLYDYMTAEDGEFVPHHWVVDAVATALAESEGLNTYSGKFRGYFPVGSASVIKARTAEEAAQMLSVALAQVGLEQEITAEANIQDISGLGCVILHDGNY